MLDARPLLRYVELRGGPASLGVRQRSPEERALSRAKTTGRVSVRLADHLAVTILGMCPLELWGDDFSEA